MICKPKQARFPLMKKWRFSPFTPTVLQPQLQLQPKFICTEGQVRPFSFSPPIQAHLCLHNRFYCRQQPLGCLDYLSLWKFIANQSPGQKNAYLNHHLLTFNIENDHSHLRVSNIWRDDTSEALLTCSIPKLKFECLRFMVYNFGEEVDPHCCLNIIHLLHASWGLLNCGLQKWGRFCRQWDHPKRWFWFWWRLLSFHKMTFGISIVYISSSNSHFSIQAL